MCDMLHAECNAKQIKFYLPLTLANKLAAYRKFQEEGFGAYQKIEDGVVGAYKNIEDQFVQHFLAKDGESTEEAKDRIQKP